MSPKSVLESVLVLLCVICAEGSAIAQMPNPYGPPISLEMARKVAVPALAEAAKNGWTMAVAIVDPAGNLVYYEKMDNTQLASAHVAVEKARTAATYKRPTQAFQDALAKGAENWRILSLPGVVAAEGGIPLVVDGKIVGASRLAGG